MTVLISQSDVLDCRCYIWQARVKFKKQIRIFHREELTEALLEPLSSSLLAGGAAPLRDRGEDAGALRRDLGGLEESSYSSAKEKRSLNLVKRTRNSRHLQDLNRNINMGDTSRYDLPHFMGFVTAGLDVLKSLKDGRLCKNFNHTKCTQVNTGTIYNHCF